VEKSLNYDATVFMRKYEDPKEAPGEILVTKI